MQVIKLAEQVGGDLAELGLGELLACVGQLVQIILALIQVLGHDVERLVRIECIRKRFYRLRSQPQHHVNLRLDAALCPLEAVLLDLEALKQFCSGQLGGRAVWLLSGGTSLAPPMLDAQIGLVQASFTIEHKLLHIVLPHERFELSMRALLADAEFLGLSRTT